jgi:histidine triad (HIT) family protein
MDPNDLTDLTSFSQKVAHAIDKTLQPIRTGVIVEGMLVPHAHIHLIPIYKESQDFSLGKKVELGDTEMLNLARRISKNVEL